MHSHDHAHKDDDAQEAHSSTPSHSESCPVGGLVSRSFILIILTVLSLAFGITMMQKYRKLEARLAAAGLELGKGGTVQAAQNTKAKERIKALNEIGQKLGTLKVNMDEIEYVLSEQGVKVEGHGKAAGPPDVH